jgi:hypothetical protein
MIVQTKEQYISPECEVLEVNPACIIAASKSDYIPEEW